MHPEPTTAIGGQWLCERYGFQVVNPLAVRSRIGGRRQTSVVGDQRTETHQAAIRPLDTLRWHLVFHLKHELPHLELLSRTFASCDPSELEQWVADEPTGEYARRAGFLYEWITGKKLAIDERAIGGRYVEALDPAKVLTASAAAANVQRWKVRDNLPGTRHFCPIVRRSAAAAAAMALDCGALINDLKDEFGDDLVMRSAVWLTLRESRASFQIEGEADQKDRIQRFARVLEQFTGTGSPPLGGEKLTLLQAAILGNNTTLERMGLRESPVFVGESFLAEEKVHYIAPPPEDVAPMLKGIETFLARTRGTSSVARSTVAAFGFVYVHPFADGNGRVHRFLINDILRRDGTVPDPIIVPISGLITREHKERRAYDAALDAFSRPLMDRLAGAYRFVPEKTRYPDGIVSNFEFTGNADARHAWRFIDYTSHVQYLADVLERTIKQDMRVQSEFLREHYAQRAALKEVIEMPDQQADRVLRSFRDNDGRLSSVLAKEIPALAREGIWEAIGQALATVKPRAANWESRGQKLAPPSVGGGVLDAPVVDRSDANGEASKKLPRPH